MNVDAATRDVVRLRADNRCEYCLLRQAHAELTHQLEHIVARQHGGSDDEGNLALACHACNLHKGPNLAGMDPSTDELTPLFHPRRDKRETHFGLRGAEFVGLTPVGRATIHLLSINSRRRVMWRRELLARLQWP